ncbi:Necrosis inducing protein NPP1 [Phytophthora megakarya]|uniref:Necrosis inducing protein NPP1 n=1 Tax=Phytophthora megakarya TaxID=4795 RepID=A0A225VN02_9STRA|nr:Necrosis inducing protein NPP1 [Phytophthora megakarya]
MKISALLGVVAVSIATTQAGKLQLETSSLSETQEQQQEQQDELQTQISVSGSASDEISGSTSSGSGLDNFLDSTSGSQDEDVGSPSSSGSLENGFDGSLAVSDSKDASGEVDQNTPLSTSNSGETSGSASSSSGDVSQGNAIDSTSGSQDAITSEASSGSSSGSNSATNSTSGSNDDSSSGTAVQKPTEVPVTPSVSFEDSVQQSESFGGPHGTEFSDEAVATSGQTIASITIRAGKRVDGIALEISAPLGTTLHHGGGGGDAKTLKLGTGEYITSMEAHWGERKGRTRIFYLSFGTSAGNSVSGGRMTENKKTVTAPEGFQLGGFYGRAGDEIDLLGAIWTSIEVVTAAPNTTPAPTTPWVAKKRGHDEVVPFKQPEPVTISEKAAIKFKPQLHISNGCHAYPAVDIAGQTSGGLQTKGAPSAACKGSGWGSQVYGRSAWHNGIWAIMYAWYFPKDSPSSGLGHRHDWEHVIVWIDNPEIPEPKILAVTPSAHSGYSAQVPPDADKVEGTSVKVNYESKWPINHALGSTTKGGDYQDLIMWHQLNEAARQGLQNTNFGKANVPMKDGNFEHKLDKAWPFKDK